MPDIILIVNLKRGVVFRFVFALDPDV